MLKRFWERRKDEEGFTLIELMVVVLIIGILIAIALPTFLGARNRANDRAAQSDLRNALAAAKTCFTDHDSYSWTTPSAGTCDTGANGVLQAIEPSLTFQAAASTTAAPNVSVAVNATGTIWGAARMSQTGTCFGIRDITSPAANAGTFRYGSTATAGIGGANCTGAAAVGLAVPTASDGTW